MQAVTFIFAFVAVLALIVVAAWLVRRFASNRLGTNTSRGRMPRLAVIDAAAVDGRRRLVLVRRDNIEHLLMIGGPTDIVVESNIVRATSSRDQLPQRPSAVEPPPRIAPLPDAGIWAEAEAVRSDDHVPLHVPLHVPSHAPAQMPEPPPRPVRPAFADDLRRPAPVVAERRADPLTGFGPEQLNFRPEPRPEPRLEPRPEPRPEPRSDPRSEQRAEPRTELRPEPRPEVRPEPMPPRMPRSDAEAIPPRMPRGEPMPRSEVMPRNEAMPRNEQMPRGEPMMPRPSRQGEPPKMPPMMRPAERAVVPPPPPPPPPAPPPSNNANADQNLAEMAQRLEAALRRPSAEPMAPPAAPEPAPTRVAMRSEPPLAPAPPAPPPKSSFENLEDEMASLLGRPKSSSSS